MPNIRIEYQKPGVFQPVTIFGKRIFDLSLVAALPSQSPITNLVRDLQEKAKMNNIPMQAPTSGQMHATLINPVFIMDKSDIPTDSAQMGAFHRFVKIMQENQHIQRPLKTGFTLTPTAFLVRERDIKLALAFSNSSFESIETMQAFLKQCLTDESTFFRFQEGSPTLHTTVFRFAEGFNGVHYRRLHNLLIDASLACAEHELATKVDINHILAVHFTGLFSPWINEASIIPD